MKHYVFSYGGNVGQFLTDPRYFTRIQGFTLFVWLILFFLLYTLPFTYPLTWPFLLALPLVYPDLRANLVGTVGLVVGASLETSLIPTIMTLALIPFWAYLGMLSGVLMHNAAHKNFRPAWLNELIGQVCGAQQLVGLPDWAVPHVLYHHRYSDSILDPHPSTRKHVLHYALTMRANIGKFLGARKVELFGPKAPLDTLILFPLWATFFATAYILLGPYYLVYAWLPAFWSTHLFFVAFNYYGHRPDSAGEFHPVNMDDTGLVWLLNHIALGTWFHENHHRAPGLINPRHLKS